MQGAEFTGAAGDEPAGEGAQRAGEAENGGGDKEGAGGGAGTRAGQ